MSRENGTAQHHHPTMAKIRKKANGSFSSGPHFSKRAPNQPFHRPRSNTGRTSKHSSRLLVSATAVGRFRRT